MTRTPTRRALLAATALVPATLLLTACPNLTVSTFVQYAKAVEGAASDVLASLGSATGLPASTVTTIQGYLTDAQGAAQAITAATTPTASLEQQLYDAVKATLGFVTVPPGSLLLSAVPAVALGLGALQAILPVIAGWLGLTGAPATVAVPGVPKMTAAQAVLLFGK